MEAVEEMATDGLVGHGEVCFNDAATIAMDLGDPSLASPIAEFAEFKAPEQLTQPVKLGCARIRGNAAMARGDDDAAVEAFATGLAIGRDLDRPGLLAPLLLDYGRWLVQTGRSEEAAPLLAEARTMFEGMRATRWLERLERVTGAPQVEAVVS
jgi:hypothetical protein